MTSYKGSNGGKIIYMDCYSGISGDMFLGALIDLGLKLEDLEPLLAGLPLSGYCLEVSEIKRGGLSATKFNVILEEKEEPARHLSHILQIINDAQLPQAVKENSGRVFRLLAEAEAKVHGTTIENVHFHEVGALDAIVDIVGTAAALHLLGVDQLHCSPLPLGRGEVQTTHGKLPLPAPATLELLARRGAPVIGSDVDFELVTPTGAALAAAFASSFGTLPAMEVEAVGYGGGSHDPGYPNYLRLIYGSCRPQTARYEEEVLLIETNIDDLNPEIYGYLMDKLFEGGALDVYYTSVQMKKNRPAVLLSVLSPPHLNEGLLDIIFNETSTLGVRINSVRKVMLARDTAVVQTDWGPVNIKYSPSIRGEEIRHFSPEYEDCLQVARKSGLPLKEVYRIAARLFREVK